MYPCPECPKMMNFFKSKNFQIVNDFKGGEGEIPLTKFRPTEFVNPKNIITPKQPNISGLQYYGNIPITSSIKKNIVNKKSEYTSKNFTDELLYKSPNIIKQSYTPIKYPDNQYIPPEYVPPYIPDPKPPYVPPPYIDDSYIPPYTPPPYIPPDYYPDKYSLPDYYLTSYKGSGYGGGYPLYGSLTGGAGGGGPKRIPKAALGRAPGKKDLIQVKSSLFRKFAFGEKDFEVDPESLTRFKKTIAQRGTFFGYDAVPTQEQLIRTERQLEKSSAEAKYLKDQKSILDIRI